MTDSRVSRPAARPCDEASRIRDEFAAMPGMRLTYQQIRRLSNLTDADCGRVLGRLVDEGVLAAHDDGFRRPDR